jgi:hypothetical protein
MAIDGALFATRVVHSHMSGLQTTPIEPQRTRLVLAPTAVEELVPAATGADRRVHRRITAAELSWLNHVRLKYGPQVVLVDLSRGGAQIETTSHRLQPGTSVVIEIAAEDKRTFAVPAQVLRCHIAGLSPTVWYRSALVFKRPFDFPKGFVLENTGDVVPTASVVPAREEVVLPASPAVLNAVGARALDAASAMLEAARGRGSTPFTEGMDRLLRLINRAIQNPSAADAIALEVVEHVRCSVPSMIVRVVEVDEDLRAGDEALTFSVPSSTPQDAARLVVEFPADCKLEAWHLQLLEGVAQLIGVTRNFESADEEGSAPKVEPEPEPAPPAVPAPAVVTDLRGWHRLVVRHLDGRMFKGFGRDFQPAKGSVQIWSEPDGPIESLTTIPFSGLKAIFFVRDFDGDPSQAGPQPVAGEKVAAGAGRRVTVTFVDGEVLRGTTMSYNQNGPGFFVSPVDSRTNNMKIFVLSGAIQYTQFR